MRRDVELHIDTLVVDGLDISDRDRLESALAQALASSMDGDSLSSIPRHVRLLETQHVAASAATNSAYEAWAGDVACDLRGLLGQ